MLQGCLWGFSHTWIFLHVKAGAVHALYVPFCRLSPESFVLQLVCGSTVGPADKIYNLTGETGDISCPDLTSSLIKSVGPQ